MCGVFKTNDFHHTEAKDILKSKQRNELNSFFQKSSKEIKDIKLIKNMLYQCGPTTILI